MKRYILTLIVIWAIIGNALAQGQNHKRYGFTSSIKVPNTKKAILMDSTMSWIRATLVNPRFNMRQVDEDQGIVAGSGSYTDDSGTTTFDLTFYFKNNLVDMVADNVVYTKVGREPRKERSKGSPRRKTKDYLYTLSHSLETHLKGPLRNASR